MEAYSPQLLAAVTHQVQQADAATLAQLRESLGRRGGPGRVLVEAEIADRARRRLHNYPLPTPPPPCPPLPPTPTPTAPPAAKC